MAPEALRLHGLGLLCLNGFERLQLLDQLVARRRIFERRQQRVDIPLRDGGQRGRLVLGRRRARTASGPRPAPTKRSIGAGPVDGEEQHQLGGAAWRARLSDPSPVCHMFSRWHSGCAAAAIRLGFFAGDDGEDAVRARPAAPAGTARAAIRRCSWSKASTAARIATGAHAGAGADAAAPSFVGVGHGDVEYEPVDDA